MHKAKGKIAAYICAYTHIYTISVIYKYSENSIDFPCMNMVKLP